MARDRSPEPIVPRSERGSCAPAAAGGGGWAAEWGHGVGCSAEKGAYKKNKIKIEKIKRRKEKGKSSLLHPAINQNTIPFSGWYCTEVDSVLTMLFSYHLLFWMNGSNPPFYNSCFLLWRGAAVEGRHVKVAVWFPFSSPWPCLCPSSPWECHASLLHFEML